MFKCRKNLVDRLNLQLEKIYKHANAQNVLNLHMFDIHQKLKGTLLDARSIQTVNGFNHYLIISNKYNRQIANAENVVIKC